MNNVNLTSNVHLISIDMGSVAARSQEAATLSTDPSLTFHLKSFTGHFTCI